MLAYTKVIQLLVLISLDSFQVMMRWLRFDVDRDFELETISLLLDAEC